LQNVKAAQDDAAFIKAILSYLIRVTHGYTTKGGIGFNAYMPGTRLWVADSALLRIAIQIGTAVVQRFCWLTVVTHVQICITSPT
jgi:hypothetical protein